MSDSLTPCRSYLALVSLLLLTATLFVAVNSRRRRPSEKARESLTGRALLPSLPELRNDHVQVLSAQFPGYVVPLQSSCRTEPTRICAIGTLLNAGANPQITNAENVTVLQAHHNMPSEFRELLEARIDSL